MEQRMKVIAESAFNHQGDFEELKRLALAAKEAGADYFTCQMMNVDAFCVSDYTKYQLYKNTEFTKEQWFELFDYCKSIEIEVIPCILEEVTLQWCNEYGYELIKLHATDITNAPLLEQISANNNLRIILETQCATAFEVEFAI
ncbi:MAG: N-acetylneuraminate synthase family protein, partial [Flavobacteriaceae bacterium]